MKGWQNMETWRTWSSSSIWSWSFTSRRATRGEGRPLTRARRPEGKARRRWDRGPAEIVSIINNGPSPSTGGSLVRRGPEGTRDKNESPGSSSQGSPGESAEGNEEETRSPRQGEATKK